MKEFIQVAMLVLTWIAITSPPRITGQHSTGSVFSIIIGHAVIIAMPIATILILELSK